MTAAIYIQRQDRHIEVTVEGVYHPGERLSLYSPGEAPWCEVSEAFDQDGKQVTLTAEEELRAEEVLWRSRQQQEPDDEAMAARRG